MHADRLLKQIWPSIGMQARSLASCDTEYSADCIEFCPHQGFLDIFVCGTYQVLEPQPAAGPSTSSADGLSSSTSGDDSESDEEADGPRRQTQRTGRLLLFCLNAEGSGFTELQRIDTPAILDASWSPQLDPDASPILAVADAKGGITRYVLRSDRRLHKVERIEVTDDTTLCLSLDYARYSNGSSNDIITSLSSGHLAHLTPTPSGYVESSAWKAHDYEPWTTAFDYWDPNRVWSGGDDCVLKAWDLRMPDMPSGRCKAFEAGVTTVTGSAYTEHLLAVGSYDANFRLFDARSLKAPLRVIPAAGGIWRTKFHPSASRKGDILLACMHDGFSVVRLDNSLISGETAAQHWQATGDDAGSTLIKRFEGHASLAYGADWCQRPTTTQEESLIASCSFYDHTMHLWRA